jgi:hypothetical protein
MSFIRILANLPFKHAGLFRTWSSSVLSLPFRPVFPEWTSPFYLWVIPPKKVKKAAGRIEKKKRGITNGLFT